MRNQPSWPLDSSEHMLEALGEQGMSPEEAAEFAPQLLKQAEWQAPVPSPADTRRLLVSLQPFMPRVSPVRQAVQARWTRPRAAFINMLALVRAQVSILHISFWLASLVITLLGAVVVFGSAAAAQDVFLRAFGPLLAYLSTVSAFRAADIQALEFELACPPSLLQLTIARLVIVLSYDVGLGLLLSLFLLIDRSTSVLNLTLSWLMPLLLVAGLALLLSLWMKVRTAALLAYSGWLAALVVSIAARSDGYAAPLLSLNGAVVTGLVGMVLLLVALLCMAKLKVKRVISWNL
ncbi:MAG: hypothetical protein ACRDIV_16620 [Ktedonobacteraceae bacterium]